MRWPPIVLAAGLLAASACSPRADDEPGDGDGDADTDADGDGDGDADTDADADGDPWGDGQTAAVFAHSASDLYAVDPDTFQVSRVGAFAWPYEDEEMTDIALDELGQMVGISFGRLYRIDPETAACTYVADLDRDFNGLSFLPAPAGGERLVGAALDGTLWVLDAANGNSTALGQFGGDLGSSGDIVFVTGLGAYATASSWDSFSDLLVRVDPDTGEATVVGDTGVSGIWGLGFWGNRFYGFTSAGAFVLIDPQSGAAEVRESGEVSWYGAGVTTIAPVLE